MTTTAPTVVSKPDLQRWVEWAAECIAYGYPQDALRSNMEKNGLDSEQAQTILGAVTSLPLYKSLERATQKYKRAYSVLDNHKRLQEQEPFSHRVERVEAPSVADFFYKHWVACRPLVITNLSKDWQISKTWTFERLLKDFADEEIEVQTNRNADRNFEINSVSHKTKVKLGWFIQTILAQQEDTNDIYMTANNQAFAKTKLKSLISEIGKLPGWMSNDPDCIGWRNFWVGPKGTITPLHHDTCALVHLQVQGSKLWRLVHPFDYGNLYNHNHVFSLVDIFNIDYSRFPLMSNVKYIDVVVNPGEALFLPLGWWHGVKSLDKSISISFTDFAFKNNCWEYSPVREIA